MRMEDEIRSHVEEEVLDNIARGMSPEAARSSALKKFGNVLQVQEDTRAVSIPVWFDQLMQDCRYALRSYSRNKLLSVTVVLTIALCIGMNTSLFSILNTMLLRPLPYPDAARLFAYTEGITADYSGRFKSGIVGSDFAEWRSQAKSFQYLAGYQYQDSTLATEGDAARVRVVSTTGDFWPLTGTQPFLGRLFNEKDRSEVAILSHRIFVHQFGSDRGVIGKAALLNGRPLVIVGVLSAEFRFLFPQDRPGFVWQDVDVYTPLPPLIRGERSRVFVVGRLNRSATPTVALAELKGIETSNLQSFPDRWFSGVDRMALQPLQERLAGASGQGLYILQAAAIFVLLIACANIANLLLSRTASRQRELSIRLSLGAGRGRVLRQFFAEGLVLAVAGALGGLILAQAFLWSMTQWAIKAIPRIAEVSLDTRVFAVTLCLTLLIAMLFCFGPATMLFGRKSSGALQRCLVASEVALALVLVAGAGLMIKSFFILHANVAGFEPQRTLVLQLSLTKPQYKDRNRLLALLEEVRQQAESIPGVQFAGISESQGYLLQRQNNAIPAIIDQFQEGLVSPGYFAAMGMQLVAGRWLEANDPADAALINQTMVRRVFGSSDPLGKNIEKLGRPVRVVGVVADLKYSKLDAEPGPELFRGYQQNLSGLPTVSIVARTKGDPLLIAAELRRRIAAIEAQESIHGVQTLETALADSIAPRRFNLILLGSFAMAALIMAIVGIYGVVSYSVTQRTREIGLRMALGARPWSIAGMLIRQAMSFTVAGIFIGLAGAYVLSISMSSLLYAVKPNDPAVLLTVATILALVSLVASALPAALAARVDPLISLRHD